MSELPFKVTSNGVQWFAGRRHEPESYSMHVSGADISGHVVRPAWFHTFAVLFPLSNSGNEMLYAATVIDHEHADSSPEEIRSIIRGFIPAARHVRQQHAIANRLMRGTEAMHWRAALQQSWLIELPVAMLCIGSTRDDSSRTVYMHTHILVPPAIVAREFKQAIRDK